MKKMLFLCVALALLSACGVSPDMTMDLDLPTCQKPTTPEICNPEGNANAPVVTFNKNTLILAPLNVCAKKGSTIEFRITPASGNLNPPGSVMVVAKKGIDSWLVGTNSLDSKEIKIPVPNWVTPSLPGEGYDYTIVSVKNGVVTCVDPRVHVQN